METWPRPRIVVSKCLGFACCRWNGETISDPFTARLGAWAELEPVCPEMEIGLGEVEDFLLKNRSPSCGTQDVKIYASGKQGSASRRGQRLFCQRMRELCPGAAWEHEGRVQNFHLREHFFTRVFTLARLRVLGPAPAVGALVDFQARHKLLLMAYNQGALRQMGPLVANAQKLEPAELARRYGQALAGALARAPKAPAVINVLLHALGYFKRALAAREKAYFLDLLEQYRQGRVPLLLLQGVLIA